MITSKSATSKSTPRGKYKPAEGDVLRVVCAGILTRDNEFSATVTTSANYPALQVGLKGKVLTHLDTVSTNLFKRFARINSLRVYAPAEGDAPAALIARADYVPARPAIKARPAKPAEGDKPAEPAIEASPAVKAHIVLTCGAVTEDYDASKAYAYKKGSKWDTDAANAAYNTQMHTAAAFTQLRGLIAKGYGLANVTNKSAASAAALEAEKSARAEAERKAEALTAERDAERKAREALERRIAELEAERKSA